MGGIVECSARVVAFEGEGEREVARRRELEVMRRAGE